MTIPAAFDLFTGDKMRSEAIIIHGDDFKYEMCACMGVQSCLTLCDPTDYSPPGSSVHGISQTRVLE